MAGLLVALKQIRNDVLSIAQFLTRIWDVRKSLSPRARSFYLLGFFGLPIICVVFMPLVAFFPSLIILLIFYDGIAAMLSTPDNVQNVQNAEWRRVE